MRTPAHLADLAPGQSATIAAIEAQAGLRNRLEALGLSRGQRVQMLRRAWLAGPMHVRFSLCTWSLKRFGACGGAVPMQMRNHLRPVFCLEPLRA